MARGTRLVSGLHAGPVDPLHLYAPRRIVHAVAASRSHRSRYLQDRSALATAGIGDGRRRAAKRRCRITLTRIGKGKLSELALDRLELYFAGRTKAAADLRCDLRRVRGRRRARRKARPSRLSRGAGNRRWSASATHEALMPRTRPTFEGYRLLREYFMMPERFHYVRVGGPAARSCGNAGPGIGNRLPVPAPGARTGRYDAAPISNCS